MANNLGNKETMAKNIRRYIDKRGTTMKDVADAIGVPYNTVNDWCNMKSYPRIDRIERMAKFFDVSKADLVDAYFSAVLDGKKRPVKNRKKLLPTNADFSPFHRGSNPLRSTKDDDL